MKTYNSILEDALKAPEKVELGPHLEAIQTLQKKKFSWREIADFLCERGVQTDHTKLIRFMKRHVAPFRVPSHDAYYAAIVALRRMGKLGLDSHGWAMLTFHFNAHNCTVTYTQLAEAASRAGAQIPTSKPWTYANSHYGTLGRELGTEIGMDFQPSSDREKPFYSSAIGLENPALPSGAQFELVMHHELAKAIARVIAEDQSINQHNEVNHA